MLLKKLTEYEAAFASEQAADYYQDNVVHWLYEVTNRTWTRTGTPDDPTVMSVPLVKRTNAGTPMLLADTALYVLGVPEELLREHGAVSQPVAEAMARGAHRVLNASVALALTGVAGPGGGSADKPVGTVHIAAFDGARLIHEKAFFPWDRRRVQLVSAFKGLSLVRQLVAG